MSAIEEVLKSKEAIRLRITFGAIVGAKILSALREEAVNRSFF